ncbi:ComF family protein, partial [Schnuerera sp.]|uniref:ComF family protein n=1 Tax=Schnuerera sp. TaxID=2794844 RepID=UPI002C402588
VSKKMNIPLLNNHLIKNKWTLDQNKLGKIERKNNLKDSFKTINAEEFKGKEILLIDDIITTGTTLEECSKSLKEGGAKKIYGLAITSSMKM